MQTLNELTIAEAKKQLKEGLISAQELTKACFKVIKRKDKEIHAFLNLQEKKANLLAREQDENVEERNSKPLGGIPIAIKDNLCLEGTKTTAGSKILENYTAPYTATAVKKLEEAGAIILGKTNLDEFAMGSSTEQSAFGATKNPLDLTRVPGGSSGGSAAAVAANMCLGALGSDTGGSIRQPAAFCGLVGIKPTYGRVSRYGLLALASSFDQIGPLAKDVRDAALLLEIISGFDPLDSTSLPLEAPEYQDNLQFNVRGLRIGLPQEFFAEGLDERIKEKIMEVVKKLRKFGVKIKKVSLPSAPYALAVYYIILPAEASTNLARYDGIKYGLSVDVAKDLLEVYEKSRAKGLGLEVKRRIMLGTYVLSEGYYDAYYLQATKVRTKIIEEYKEVFKKVDLLITPVTPTLPFKLGEKTGDPLSMYLSDIYTVPVNVAGVPAMSLPCGKIDHLPIGMQIIGPHFGEHKIFQLAYCIEQAIYPAQK